MIEIFQQLNAIGWETAIVTIMLVIALVPLVVKSWNEFISVLGLKTKKSIEEEKNKRAIHDLVDEVNRFQQEMYDRQKEYHQQSIDIRNGLAAQQESLKLTIQEVSTALSEMRDETDQRLIKDLRTSILDFANSLERRERDIEEYENVFEMYEDYEKLLEKHGMVNGRTSRAMERIKSCYDKINV